MENIVKKARDYAMSEIEKFGSPSLTHFEISEKKALELTKKLNADNAIVQLGVSLMDLKLGHALKNGMRDQHIIMSKEAAENLLNNFQLKENIYNNIINCIEAHHGDIPYSCLEAEICANADCYRFIHPKGFLSYLTHLGKRFTSFSDCLDQAEKKMDEKYKILSLEICKKELIPYYKQLKQLIKDARNFDS